MEARFIIELIMVALHFAESNDELIVQKYNYQGCKSLTKDDDFLKKHEEAHPFFFRDPARLKLV